MTTPKRREARSHLLSQARSEHAADDLPQRLRGGRRSSEQTVQASWAEASGDAG
jgi:hypothetical protein